MANDTVFQQKIADSLNGDVFCNNVDFIPAANATACQEFMSPLAKPGLKVLGEALKDKAANICTVENDMC